MNTRTVLAAIALMLPSVACREDIQSPSEPAIPTSQPATPAVVILAFSQIDGGTLSTCGRTTDHRLYCWGDGIAGDGSGPTQHRTPVRVAGGLSFQQVSGGLDFNCAVTTVLGGLTFGSLNAAGGIHTCGITLTHVAYCWGDDFDGQLGDGGSTNRSRPVKVAGAM
jgi:alpha-tubulin suppressor-like RCC1 family protein